jgi:cyanophycinase
MRRWRWTVGALAILCLLGGLPAAPMAGAVESRGFGYRSWIRGNPRDAHVTTTGGAMLEGGAVDIRPAWAWFLERAGYGDIVIICATCGKGYDPWVFRTHEVDSVQTLRITKRRAAFDPYVVGTVASADGIFFAGGDQSDYVRIWKDTPVSAAVDDVIARGGSVGGISAGLAILGQFLFSAEKNTITSDRALRNCFNRKIRLERDMVHVPTLGDTITDSHFSDSDRLGRLLTFMARTIRDGWTTDVRGIGVDAATAVLVEPDGAATVVGRESATFIRMGAADVRTCEPGEPVETAFVPMHVLEPGDTFDLATWSGDPDPPSLVRAFDGVLQFAVSPGVASRG